MNESEGAPESQGPPRVWALDKGPAEVLRALLFGTPEEVKEAMAFQRESFRAKFGCYPEEMVEVEDGPGRD